MEKKCFRVKANEVNFYCEMRGQGPLLVFVPDGCNDCQPFDRVSDLLADEFTVLTFDMRGSVRSTVIGEPMHVTPKMLAGDVAGIIKELKLGPASIYGCSSGGQAVLAVGKYYPEVARNLLVHEAALQADTPIPNTGFEYFKNILAYEPYCNGFTPSELTMVCSYEKWRAMGEEFLERVGKNRVFWGQYYLGTVDLDTYSAEDLSKMPNLDFSVGTWTPSWLVYANIETAERGNKSVTWLPCAHYPQVVCPKELADYIRKRCKRYL
jgi:pimeloyl-ACP methyl ester carboxylesterase